MKKCMDSDNLHRRLKKIIGQVQAIDRMIDEDVPCEDILSQLNAAKSALNKCGQVVLEGHINHCIKDALESGDEEGAGICQKTCRSCCAGNLQCRSRWQYSCEIGCG